MKFYTQGLRFYRQDIDTDSDGGELYYCTLGYLNALTFCVTKNGVSVETTDEFGSILLQIGDLKNIRLVLDRCIQQFLLMKDDLPVLPVSEDPSCVYESINYDDFDGLVKTKRYNTMTLEEVNGLLKPFGYEIYLVNDPEAKTFGDYAWTKHGDPPDWDFLDGTPEEMYMFVKGMIDNEKS